MLNQYLYYKSSNACVCRRHWSFSCYVMLAWRVSLSKQIFPFLKNRGRRIMREARHALEFSRTALLHSALCISLFPAVPLTLVFALLLQSLCCLSTRVYLNKLQGRKPASVSLQRMSHNTEVEYRVSCIFMAEESNFGCVLRCKRASFFMMKLFRFIVWSKK